MGSGDGVDLPRIERAVREILAAIGEDPGDERLRETPERVAEAYAHLFSGLREDPVRHLEVAFPQEGRDLVLLRDVPLASMCVPGKQIVNAVGGAKKAADVGVGDELWTLDRGFLTETRVTDVASHETYDTVCVRTTGGSIRVTADHPVKGELGWCEAGKLRPGDKVEWFPPRRLCRKTPRVVPGYQLGYLIGAIASEGSFQDERRISVVVSDPAFADRVALAWRDAFSLDAKVERIQVNSGFLKRKVPMCRVRVVSSYAATKIMRWLGLPKDRKDKTRGFRFPKVVTASREMMDGFLDGFIEGDGTRCGSGNQIITANGSFAQELADYLQTPVGRGRGDISTVYVSSRWHEPGWKGKHGFRQQSEWYVPADSEYVEVIAVEPTPKSTKPATVYSFKCEPYPTFLIGGHLTHNCEHHLLPFVGKAHVGYVPDGRVVGLSEIVAVVEGYARRPQIQERLTARIADALYEPLGSLGSVVVIEAEQLCMTMRGAQKPGTVTVTSAARGVFEAEPARRAEFLALVSSGR